MAIAAFTRDPAALLSSIKKAIDDKKVETWKYDKDGDLFHTPEQWRGKAWLRPIVQQGMLVLGLVGQQNVQMSKLIYGVYHGRFIEMLLTHFDDKFTTVNATAVGDSGDLFK